VSLSDTVANSSVLACVRTRGVSDGPTWPVLQEAPSEHYFAQQQRPTPPQTSGAFSDAGSENRLHSVDIVTELPTGGSHSYEQLAAATDGFAPGNIIGQGGFGCVYRGRLDGAEVAVKKLKTESRQGDREFRAEVEIISRVHHRNLVTLIGYCIYSDERLLVYEFVPNRTLDTHLHGKLLEVLGPRFCLFECSMNVLGSGLTDNYFISS